MRVASDGDNSSDAGSGTAAPEQSVDASSGSAQVGSPNAAAPVRVLSDGDNSTATEAGAGAGPQTVGDSSGSAQVGSPSLFAPVRVLSGGTGPGDESDAADAGDLAEGLLGELLGNPSGGGGEWSQRHRRWRPRPAAGPARPPRRS